jgi:hypothetical protein
MRALKVGLALGAVALMLCVLTSASGAQERARQRPPFIRVYSTSGVDYINTSTYIEPQIELSENAYVFAVAMDLDGQIQVLHPDFPGLSVKISAHTNLRLPNFFAGFNQAYPNSGVYTSARFQRYSQYGGYMDTHGTVLALASRTPFDLDAIETGGDWNISAIRRLIENRTPLDALNVLANYLGAKDEPIGRDFLRFAGGATNSYAYNDYGYNPYGYYSPCDPYYGYFSSPFGFSLFQTLNLPHRARLGQKARVIGFDACGVPIVSYGPVVVSRFPVTGRPPRLQGDTTVFPKGRFPHDAMPRHPSEASRKAAPEGIFPLPRSVGDMGDVTITAPKGRRSEPRIIDTYRSQPSTIPVPQGRMPIERSLPRSEPSAASGSMPSTYRPEPRVESPPPSRVPVYSPPPPVIHAPPSTPPPPPPRVDVPVTKSEPPRTPPPSRKN